MTSSAHSENAAPSAAGGERPLVASLIGTFLKPEMLSVYRQVTGLARWRAAVLTEQRANASLFPFDPVIQLRKRPFRPRGNFLRRFYWKHLRKTWPPPGWTEPVPPRDFEFCDLLPRLRDLRPRLLHIYYGHKARKYLPLVERWGGPLLVSFHGVDVARDVDKTAYHATFADVFRRAAIVAARSSSLLEELAALGCPREKLRLNRTPIPLDHLPFIQRQPPPGGRWIFAQACRLIPKKGLLTTLAALRIVTARHPGVRFIVAGDGPMKNELQQTAATLGLADNFELAGWLDQPALRSLYQRAHLFLHPSETTATGDQEGIPNSMLEAMATGLPVVATRHGGIPEAVTDGHDGLLVPEKDPSALASALLRIIETPGLLAALSTRAAESVKSRFGLKQSIAALETCYDEAVSA